MIVDSGSHKIIVAQVWPGETTEAIDMLHAAFIHDSETGLLWSRKTKRIAGSIYPTGYVKIGFAGTILSAHRLIYAMYYNKWPNLIDHKNRIRSDNRINNIQSVNASINNKNRNKISNSVISVRYYKNLTALHQASAPVVLHHPVVTLQSKHLETLAPPGSARSA